MEMGKEETKPKHISSPFVNLPRIKLGPRGHLSGESFTAYHARLKRENENIKIHLKGTYLVSTGFINRKIKSRDFKLGQLAMKKGKPQKGKVEVTAINGSPVKDKIASPVSGIQKLFNRMRKGSS